MTADLTAELATRGWVEARVRDVAHVNPSVAIPQPSGELTFLPMTCVGVTGDVDYSRRVSADLLDPGFTRFSPGDVLVAKITPCFENGKGAVLSELPTAVGVGSTEFHVLRPRSSDARFLYWMTVSPDFRGTGTQAMVGAAGQKRVPAPFVRTYAALWPPLGEQGLISKFLEHKSLEVTRAIRAKHEVARLLLESRDQSIWDELTSASAAEQQSLVEWMGPVPRSFDMSRLKSHLREVNLRTGDGHEELLSLRMREGLVPSSDYSRAQPSPEQLVGYKKVRPGDLVMNRMRASIGLFGIADRTGLVSPDYAVFEARSDVHLPFLLHLLKSRRAGAIIRAESRGMGTGSAGFLRIYTDRFGTIPVALPPQEEQRRRAGEASARVEHINRALTAIDAEIDLLREYRTRLIADVVTGRLDVRAEAAALPEIDPEELSEAYVADATADIDLEVAHAD